MRSEQRWISLKIAEGVAKGRISLLGGIEVAIVGCGLPGGLPDAFDGVELGRVGRQPTQFDAVLIRGEPGHALSLEVVARGVVDDQDHLAPIAAE